MPRLLRRHLTAIVIGAALCCANAVAAVAQTPILSATEAAERLADGSLILLDIRRPQEWAESGVAQGAWPVSMHTQTFPAQLQEILSRYDASDIALICAVGGRTEYVTDILRQNGVTGVWDLSEGMFGNGNAPGWLARGLPVVTDSAAMAQYEAARAEWK